MGRKLGVKDPWLRILVPRPRLDWRLAMVLDLVGGPSPGCSVLSIPCSPAGGLVVVFRIFGSRLIDS